MSMFSAYSELMKDDEPKREPEKAPVTGSLFGSYESLVKGEPAVSKPEGRSLLTTATDKAKAAGGAVSDTLEEFTRPYHAMYGGLHSLLDTSEDDPGFWGGLAKGWNLEEKKGGSDLLYQALGVHKRPKPTSSAGKWAEFINRLALELVSPDPLLFLSKPGKIARALQKTSKVGLPSQVHKVAPELAPKIEARLPQAVETFEKYRPHRYVQEYVANPIKKRIAESENLRPFTTSAGPAYSEFDEAARLSGAATEYDIRNIREEIVGIDDQITKDIIGMGVDTKNVDKVKDMARVALERPETVGSLKAVDIGTGKPEDISWIVERWEHLQSVRWKLQEEINTLREPLNMPERGFVGRKPGDIFSPDPMQHWPRFRDPKTRTFREQMNWVRGGAKEADTARHRDIMKYTDPSGTTRIFKLSDPQSPVERIDGEYFLRRKNETDELIPVDVQHTDIDEAESLSGRVFGRDAATALTKDFEHKLTERNYLQFLNKSLESGHLAQVTPDMVVPKGFREVNIPELKNVIAPKGVANQAENIANAHLNPEKFITHLDAFADAFFNQFVVGRALKGFRRVWAENVLGGHPGYHSRNALSNMALVYQKTGADHNALKNAYDAEKLLIHPNKGAAVFPGHTNEEVVELLDRAGVINRSWSKDELLRMADTADNPRLMAKLWKGQEDVPLQANDWVKAADLENYGKIRRVNPDGTADVHFVNKQKGTEATVKMHMDDLTRAHETRSDVIARKLGAAGPYVAAPGRALGWWNRWGFHIGGVIEDHAKITLTLTEAKRLMKAEGLPLQEAIEQASHDAIKYLFDYSKTSRLENNLKTLIPFYTWHKNIQKRFIGEMFDNPKRFSEFERVAQTLFEPLSEGERDLHTEWQRQMGFTTNIGPYSFGFNPQGVPMGAGPGAFSPWFTPTQALSGFSSRPGDQGMRDQIRRGTGELLEYGANLLNPALKGLGEGAVNFSTFRRKPIDAQAGGPLSSMYNWATGDDRYNIREELFGVPIPAGASWASSQFNPFHRYMFNELDMAYQSLVDPDPYKEYMTPGQSAFYYGFGGKSYPYNPELAGRMKKKEQSGKVGPLPDLVTQKYRTKYAIERIKANPMLNETEKDIKVAELKGELKRVQELKKWRDRIVKEDMRSGKRYWEAHQARRRPVE